MICPDCKTQLRPEQTHCLACGWEGESVFKQPECKYCHSMKNVHAAYGDGFCCDKCWPLHDEEKNEFDLMIDEQIRKECARNDSGGAAFRVMCDENATDGEREEARKLYMKLRGIKIGFAKRNITETTSSTIGSEGRSDFAIETQEVAA